MTEEEAGAEPKPEEPAQKAGEAEENGERKKRKRKSGWDDVPAASPSAAAAAAASVIPPVQTGLTPIQQEAIKAAQAMQLQKQTVAQTAVTAAQAAAAGVGIPQALGLQAAGLQAAGLQAAGSPGGVPLGRLYVGSLHYDLKEAELRGIFEPFGPIKAIDLSFEPATGKSKGFAFVEFADPAHADACQKAMDGFNIAGRPIKIGRPHNVTMATTTPGVSVNPQFAQLGALGAMGVQGMMGGVGMIPGVGGLPGMAGMVNPMTGMVNPMLNFQQNALAAQQQANAQAVLAAQQKAAQAVAVAAAQKPAGPPSRIYVGSVYFEIGEKEIEQVFSAFGKVKNVSMIPNSETGKHKGYGFVEFESSEAAQQAIQVMNGFELGGRALKVGWANSALQQPTGLPADPTGNSAALAAAAAAAAAAQLNVSGGGLAGLQATAAGAGLAGVGALGSTVVGSVASEENVSVATAAQKAALMAKLAQRPSKVVVLKNMVDPEEVDEQLEEEITEECSKFGSVTKVIIATLEEGGKKLVKIFVVFAEEPSTAKAVKALDKRWFGGKVVSATVYDQDKFQRQDYTG